MADKSTSGKIGAGNPTTGNWANGNLVSGIFDFGGSALGLYGQYSGIQKQQELARIRAQQYPNELAQQQRQEQTANTLLWVFGGIALVVFVLIVYFALR